jgi:hypothetical protein
VVLQDLLHHGQPEPRHSLFSPAHKRLEDRIANRRWNAGAIIGDPDLDAVSTSLRAYFNNTGDRRDGLTRVVQQVQYGAFELTRIESGTPIVLAGRIFTI